MVGTALFCPARRRTSGWLLVLALALGGVVGPAPAHAADAREEALDLSKQALDAYLAGQFANAASLYQLAFQTWPSEAVYLYNAARALERAGRLQDAERSYQKFLDLAPAGHPEAGKARFHLDEIRQGRQRPLARLSETARLPDKPPPPAPADPGAARTAAGTALIVGGAALAVGGGVLLGLAASQQSSLDVRLAQLGPDGQIVGIDHTTATAEQSSINTKTYVGWGMLGGGVVAGTIGTVLVLTAPDRRVVVAPWPTGSGLLVTARF